MKYSSASGASAAGFHNFGFKDFPIADTQISELGVCCRLATDPQVSNISSGSRHIAVIEPAKEAAGYRHAWRLKFDRIGQREEAILRVSAGFSQISDAPRPAAARVPALYLVE